ncbi:MAG: GNAT family N-acetyltransferase [Promethearchaeota archaeon]
MISIRVITEKNWFDAARLNVKEEHANFVASNAISIAQSKFHPFIECFGIYFDNEMVGFSAVRQNPADKTVWIVRHTIDVAHQGEGYSKASLKEIIQHLRRKSSLLRDFPRCGT